MSEPIGSVSPKIHDGDKSVVMQRQNKKAISLLCPAQAYPTPISRYDRKLCLWFHCVFFRLSFLCRWESSSIHKVTQLKFSFNYLYRTNRLCQPESQRRRWTQYNETRSSENHKFALSGSSLSNSCLQVKAFQWSSVILLLLESRFLLMLKNSQIIRFNFERRTNRIRQSQSKHWRWDNFPKRRWPDHRSVVSRSGFPNSCV